MYGIPSTVLCNCIHLGIKVYHVREMELSKHLSFEAPQKKRTAFVICGSPGSGKSTYGRRLSKERKIFLLDIDTVSERLVQAGLALAQRDQNDRDSVGYKESFREPIYLTLFDIAKENLQWQDVVIVGPFTQELRNPEWPSELSKMLRCVVEVHYVWCAREIRKQRLSRRANPRDRAKLLDWEHHIQYYGDERPPDFPHISINTS